MAFYRLRKKSVDTLGSPPRTPRHIFRARAEMLDFYGIFRARAQKVAGTHFLDLSIRMQYTTVTEHAEWQN